MIEKQSGGATEVNGVTAWFGKMFFELHPRLQILHRQGGNLKGKVQLNFGQGLAGVIGRRIARKLGVPLQPGEHELRVEIRHVDSDLHWIRCFDAEHVLRSIFTPVGNYQQGYWLEKTGPVSLKLTVDVIDGAWHWRVIAASLFDLPLPLLFFPDSVAYKKVIDDSYLFHVGFSMPIIGNLFSYEGRLVFEPG